MTVAPTAPGTIAMPYSISAENPNMPNSHHHQEPIVQGEVADVAPIVRDEREQRQYTDRDTENLSGEDWHGRGNYLADGILLMGVDEERGTALSPRVLTDER
ncbi:hypothetical protein NKJ35_07900 [Mesorhizobium sp. M0136]|uniref:hypothetical protein n=1 Tax=Mesorhizobium sp. M0136 TaxID=2956890 RepID=UPI00333CA32E